MNERDTFYNAHERSRMTPKRLTLDELLWLADETDMGWTLRDVVDVVLHLAALAEVAPAQAADSDEWTLEDADEWGTCGDDREDVMRAHNEGLRKGLASAAIERDAALAQLHEVRTALRSEDEDEDEDETVAALAARRMSDAAEMAERATYAEAAKNDAQRCYRAVLGEIPKTRADGWRQAIEAAARLCDNWSLTNQEAFFEQSLAVSRLATSIRALAPPEAAQKAASELRNRDALARALRAEDVPSVLAWSESPPFKPSAGDDLEARGFVRENRYDPKSAEGAEDVPSVLAWSKAELRCRCGARVLSNRRESTRIGDTVIHSLGRCDIPAAIDAAYAAGRAAERAAVVAWLREDDEDEANYVERGEHETKAIE